MGCLYACTCGNICIDCKNYRQESYCGEAENLLATRLGFENNDDFMEYMNTANVEQKQNINNKIKEML